MLLGRAYSFTTIHPGTKTEEPSDKPSSQQPTEEYNTDETTITETIVDDFSHVVSTRIYKFGNTGYTNCVQVTLTFKKHGKGLPIYLWRPSVLWMASIICKKREGLVPTADWMR